MVVIISSETCFYRRKLTGPASLSWIGRSAIRIALPPVAWQTPAFYTLGGISGEEVVRAFLPMMSGLMLGACGAGDATIHGILGPQSGNVWKVEQKTDQISGLPTATAWIRTLSTNNSKNGDISSTMLQLMCFKGNPIVRLNFGSRVGSNRNSTVGYRFDQKPGRDVDVTFLPDFKTIIIEEKADVEQFLNELAVSSLLLVRVSSLFAGRTTAEFALNGAPQAIEAAYAQCPVKPDKPAKRA
jgi:hypothetical protein